MPHKIIKYNVEGIDLYLRDRSYDLSVAIPILRDDEYVLQPLKDQGIEIKNVVDLGGHIGSFTVRAMNLWPKAKIYVVEPAEDNLEVLEKNILGHKNVKLFKNAITGDFEGEVLLCNQPGEHEEASRFVINNLDAIGERKQPERIFSVTALPIKKLFSQIKGDIDILKVDCEGSEGVVFQSLSKANLLKRVKWIRGEWHGYRNLEILNATLSQTHDHATTEMDDEIGCFIAHRRDLA